jgi:hypothetical protein
MSDALPIEGLPGASHTGGLVLVARPEDALQAGAKRWHGSTER